MSNPHLPPEILDYIVDNVDLLHDTKHALMNCCLVSKSWIPRTRKHLFAHVSFFSLEDLKSWKRVFPDPSTSPACYTQTLLVGCSNVVVAADAEAGGWITGFSRIVDLELGVGIGWSDHTPTSPLTPFYGCSPAIRSLRVSLPTLPSSQILDLIVSFPLLEDLNVIAPYDPTKDGDGSDRLPTIVRPSGSPPFTGSLVLLGVGIKHIIRRLLSLPGGLHFKKFTWAHMGDPLLVTALVEACSHTLESLEITRITFGTPIQYSTSLSASITQSCSQSTLRSISRKRQNSKM